MPKVLCFQCGSSFLVPFGTEKPTEQCPRCADKPENKMMDIGFGKDDFWKTQETFE